MGYDFDMVHDRRNSNSVKYGYASSGVASDVLPMWVADMDFRAPDEVVEAIEERTTHGIFGYSEPTEEYFSALKNWLLKRHDWRTESGDFVITPGVVGGISAILRAMTREGDCVLVCQPVYYPFADVVRSNGRRLVVSKLIEDGGFYKIDFEDFERKIEQECVKVFILCNPHNPIGRVWTKEELLRISKICLAHGVFVISDEIHFDFTFSCKHTVFATLDEDAANNCAVCTAPTKTFNLAGLHISNVYIKNESVRNAVSKELAKQGIAKPNLMGIVACQAAYANGESWLDELLAYLAENIAFAKNYISKNIPEISFLEPQGTYLVWLDMRGLGLDDKALGEFMLGEAKLWLDDGFIFGDGGSGFERVNVACPRSVLKNALERLDRAVAKLRGRCASGR